MVLIQTTLAMLAISRPDNLYVPDIAHATSLSDEDDQEDVLPNVDVHAIVYAYCERKGAVPSSDEYPYYDPSRHGRPVYVGQTMQTLAERDAQHIRCKDTPFDRQYGDRSQYVLVRLDERTFPRAASDNDFLEHTLRPAAEWMDVRETRRIKEFDTYHQGLNSTKGGQGRGWLVAECDVHVLRRTDSDGTPAAPATTATRESDQRPCGCCYGNVDVTCTLTHLHLVACEPPLTSRRV